MSEPVKETPAADPKAATPPAEPAKAGTPNPETPPEPTPAAPPAAKAVIEGKTEREIELEKKLKDRETRMAELEDENVQLKKLPKEQPKPAKKEKSPWRPLISLDDEED